MVWVRDEKSTSSISGLPFAVEAVRLKDFSTFQKLVALLKEMVIHFMEEAYSLSLPVPNEYTFWQPWLKGYNGEFGASIMNQLHFFRYTWVDQELKTELAN